MDEEETEYDGHGELLSETASDDYGNHSERKASGDAKDKKKKKKEKEKRDRAPKTKKGPLVRRVFAVQVRGRAGPAGPRMETRAWPLLAAARPGYLLSSGGVCAHARCT